MPTLPLAVRVLLLSLLVVAACAEPPAPQGDAEALALIERAQTAHGSGALDRAVVTFAFRGTPFTAWRDGARFRYARTLTDSLGRTVEEVVDNAGAHRFVDGEHVPLDAAEAERLTTAVNSVVYFGLLPYALTDPAVQAQSLGPDSVGGAAYDRLGITFAEAGGGADWEDRYVYWIDAQDGAIDYLAYSYAPTPGDTSRNETGTRFREVIGVVPVGGVRFQQYRNLTSDSVEAGTLERYGDLYDAGQTWTVSEVVLDSIRVRPL